MKLSRHQIAEIHHLSVVEGWSNYALSQRYDVHHSTIARALAINHRSALEPPMPDGKDGLPTMIKPFLPQMRKILDAYQAIPATRIAEMLREKGFNGSINTVRRGVRALRKSRKDQRAYTKREVFAGAEAQVDWAEFRKMRFADGESKVYLLVIVLSWSRDIYAHAFTDMKGPTLCRGHAYAFKHFGGIPNVCLYDNMKTMVLRTESKLATFNEDFLSFATDYGFRLRNCNPRQPQEKGRVERSIRYLRESFFTGRDFLDLSDLNHQLHHWLKEVLRQRRWPDNRKFDVGQQADKERSHLNPLPVKLWLPKGKIECRVHKTPYVHFQSCKYSTPPELVGRMVSILYDDETIEVWAGGDVHAIHERSYRQGKYIESEEHILGMAKYHNRGSTSTKQSALMRIVPQIRELFEAQRRRNLPTTQPTRFLFDLLENYGSERLGQAVEVFISSGSQHLDSLERILKNQDPNCSLKPLPRHLLPRSIKAETTIHQDLSQYSSSQHREKQ